MQEPIWAQDYYFASISAIYTVLKPEEVGATKNYLLHAGLSGNGTVCTKKAIIKQSTLIRCSRHQDGADWRKNAVRTAFWRCCIWMLFGGVERSPFFVSQCAFFALGVTLGVTIRGYILCVVMFLFRGYIFIYFGVTLGVTFAVFFFLLRDRETDYLSKLKSIFSV